MTDIGRATIPLAALVNVADWAPSMRDNPWLEVEDWYIDGENSTGLASDSNTGTSADAPLLTKRQLSKRLGFGQLPKDVRVHLMSGEASGDDGRVYCNTAVGILCYYGTKTLITQGTITSAADRVIPSAGSTGGTRATITISGIDWSLYTDGTYVVENVTRGSFFGIYANLGSNTASIEQPITDVDPISEFGDPNNLFSASSPSNQAGDTFKLWKIPTHTFSGMETGGAKNFVGVGFVDMVIQPSEADYYSVRYTGIQLVRCKTLGYWSAVSPSNCPMYVVGTRIDGLGFECGQGAIVGGSVPGTIFNVGSEVALTGGLIANLSAGAPKYGGLWQLADVCILGNVDTHNVEGGPYQVSNVGSISVYPYFLLGSLGAVWGTGTIRGHAGAVIRYGTSAAASFRNAGGITVDGGAQAFAYDSSGPSVTGLRSVTVANLDAAVSSGGFGGNAQTVKGTRVVLAA